MLMSVLCFFSWGVYAYFDTITANKSPGVENRDIWAVRFSFLPPSLIVIIIFFFKRLAHHTQQTLMIVYIAMVNAAASAVGWLFHPSNKMSMFCALLSSSFLIPLPTLPNYWLSLVLIVGAAILRESFHGVHGIDLAAHCAEYLTHCTFCISALVEIQACERAAICSLMIRELRYLDGLQRGEALRALIERSRHIFKIGNIFLLVQSDSMWNKSVEGGCDSVTDGGHQWCSIVRTICSCLGDDRPFNNAAEEEKYWEQDQPQALAFALSMIPQLILTEGVLGVFDILQLPGGEALLLAKYAVSIPWCLGVYTSMRFFKPAHTRALLLSCFTVTTLATVLAYDLWVPLPTSAANVTAEDLMRASEVNFQVIVLWLGFWTDTRTTVREVAAPLLVTLAVFFVLHSRLQNRGVPWFELDFTIFDTVKNFVIVWVIGSLLSRHTNQSRRTAFILQTIMNAEAASTASSSRNSQSLVRSKFSSKHLFEPGGPGLVRAHSAPAGTSPPPPPPPPARHHTACPASAALSLPPSLPSTMMMPSPRVKANLLEPLGEAK
jgi:hypothetical protein